MADNSNTQVPIQNNSTNPQQQPIQNSQPQNQGQPITNPALNQNSQTPQNQIQQTSGNQNPTPQGQQQSNQAQPTPVVGKRFVDLLSSENFVTVSWIWKQPEKINETKVKKGWEEAQRFSEHRVKTVEDIPTYPREAVRDFILQEEEDLKSAVVHCDKIVNAASALQEAQTELARLRDERQKLQPNYQAVSDAYNKSSTTVAELLVRVETDRNESLAEINKFSGLALKVDTAELAKLQLKDIKKKTNVLFSWIHATVLGQPKNSYNWEQFKKDNLSADNSKGFKLALANYNLRYESLSGLPEATMKALEAAYPSHAKLDLNLTNEVLNDRNNIITECKVKNVESESIKALLEYVSTVKKIIDKSKDMQSLNAQYNQLSGELRQRSIDLINCEKSIESLDKRIQILNDFVGAFQKELQSFEYIKKISLAKSTLHETYVQQLGGKEKIFRSKSIPVSPVELRKSVTKDPEENAVNIDEIQMDRGCGNTNCSNCSIF